MFDLAIVKLALGLCVLFRFSMANERSHESDFGETNDMSLVRA